MEQIASEKETRMGRSEATVLQHLKERGESSVTELARVTGLGKATVSRAVSSLRGKGIIEETGSDFRTAHAGRAGRALRLNPESGLYLGLAIGPGTINAVVADAAKQVRSYVTMAAQAIQNIDADITELSRAVEEALRLADCEISQLRGIGVAIGAPVDPDTEVALASSLVPQWVGRPIRNRLEEHFKIPVFVDNESNCSALAEVLWGGAPQKGTIAYIKFDKGVGGALIENGDVRRGVTGKAGEFGHISYDRHGAYCRCGGRGCFENYLSLPTFVQNISSIHGPLTFDDILVKLEEKDHAIERVVRETGAIAGDLLNIISHTIDPDLFILGGNMTGLGPVFIEAIQQRHGLLNKKIAPIKIGSAVQVLSGTRQQDEPALGAIGLVLKSVRL